MPALKTRVTDLTQTLTQAQLSQLETKLTTFEQQKGSQIAVLIVPTTAPEDIAQFSIRVVDSWQLGRAKQDDGILMLVAKNDRKMRIEVGYGLEGQLTDLQSAQIIREILTPAFKAGEYAGGLGAAIDAIGQAIATGELPPPQSRGFSISSKGFFTLFFFVIFISPTFTSYSVLSIQLPCSSYL